MHLEDYLESNAKRYPHKTAMVCGQEQCTYEELYDRVVSRMEELRTSYPQKGHIVCLRAFPTIDYLVTGYLFCLTSIRVCCHPIRAEYTGRDVLQDSKRVGAAYCSRGHCRHTIYYRNDRTVEGGHDQPSCDYC